VLHEIIRCNFDVVSQLRHECINRKIMNILLQLFFNQDHDLEFICEGDFTNNWNNGGFSWLNCRLGIETYSIKELYFLRDRIERILNCHRLGTFPA